MPPKRLYANVVNQAKAIRIEAIIDDRGIKLKRKGCELVGPCPRCGGTDRFAAHIQKQVFNCRGCGGKGCGAVSLVQFLDGVGFREACERLTGYKPTGCDKPPQTDAASARPDTERKIATTYPYTDSNGTLLYEAVRCDPKGFWQRQPDGRGGWINNLDGLKGKRVLYRWPELLKFPAATVFICEGEKDAERVALLGHCATTIAGDGKWTEDCVGPLKGRDVFILEDNDDTGRKKALKAASALDGSTASIRIVRLPGLAEGGDVSDWLDADAVNAGRLADICVGSPEWTPPPQSTSEPGSGLDVVCMADVKAAAIEWLWRNWIAIGKVHVLAGEGGRGKSTILCSITATTTAGTEWPDGKPVDQTGSVIILAAEDAVEDTLAPRLMAAGADLSRVFVIRSVLDESRRRSFNLQADLGRLEAEIQKHDSVRLVIIDPVSSYLGKIDSHKNADVRSVLEPLGEMAARLRVAIICNNHFSKGGGSANSRVIGSVAFVNQARAAFIVTPDDKDETRMLLIPSKMNIAPIRHGLAYRIEGCLIEFEGKEIPTSRIMYESAPITITADQALAALDCNSKNRSEKSEAIDFLTDALRNGPVSAKDMKREAAEAGISPKSLRSAREALGIKPEKTGFEGGWVWAPPPEDALGRSKMPVNFDGHLGGSEGTFGGNGGITIGSSSELADGRTDLVKH